MPVLPCILRDVKDVDRRDTHMVKPRARGFFMAHRFSWRSEAVCLKLGVDRTWLANCKSVEIDPRRIPAVTLLR